MNEKVVHYITSKYLPDKEGEPIQATRLPKKRIELPFDVYVIREDLEEMFLNTAEERGITVLKLKSFKFDFSEDLETGALYTPPRFT